MSRGEKIFQTTIMVFLIFLFGTIAGYAWRMVHDNKKPVLGVGTIHLGDLSMEIGKGKEFWLPVDDNYMLHFLPLRKAQYEMAIRREKR
jgi:uncharacterized oligopeptide transporter (OPT) family protein